ncbi:UNVERIFIED_CONTAM: hypothetical protein GTU68_027634 [Idotea baltica]|nr:hypothetical protein [Idotea baltica]
MERMTPNRPLTHDLFKNTLDTFEVDLKEVVINDLLDGIFYAKLVCLRKGEIIEIDSRTSDALAMAVRFNCPVYTYEFILNTAGVILDDTSEQVEPVEKSLGFADEPTPKKKGGPLSSYSIESLKTMLEEVLKEENYEKAARIRDEISKRTQGS